MGALAAAVAQALAPVAPSVQFRGDLARVLAATARQRQAPQIILQMPPSHRREFIIGAAAISSLVSVAGLIAILRRQRPNHVIRQAS